MLNIRNTRFAFLRLAPDNGAPTGGGPDHPKPASLTLEQQLSKARDDLAASNKEAERLKPFESQAATLTSERDSLQSQFNELTKTANKSKDDLAAANSTIGTLTGARDTARNERDTARNERDTANKNVTRLEALCGVKGIDTNAAPPVVIESTEKRTYAQWDAKVKAATSDSERAKIMSDFEAAVKAGNIAAA